MGDSRKKMGKISENPKKFVQCNMQDKNNNMAVNNITAFSGRLK